MKLWLIAAVALCLCQTGQSQDRLYRASVATVVVAHAVDAHSSWGKCCEANPLLGRGTFGARHAAIKAAWVTGPLIVQARSSRRHRRWMTWVNFGATGALLLVAHHNYRISK